MDGHVEFDFRASAPSPALRVNYESDGIGTVPEFPSTETHRLIEGDV